MYSFPKYQQKLMRPKSLKTSLLAAALVLTIATAFADTDVLVIRHGEKSAEGLGQITCQGLNRALALPEILEARFGRPDAVIAANPGYEKPDHGVMYSYVRPLATVEPTAVRFGLPVNATIAFDNTEGLKKLLSEMIASNKYRRILVGWEHHLAGKLVKEMVEASGSKEIVPKWNSADFDAIYIMNFKDSGEIAFRLEQQGLNGQADVCPQPVTKGVK
jgi:hypothetical protein